MSYLIIGGIVLGSLFGVFLLLSIMFRVVVPTNEVHIVQTGKRTRSYGRSKETEHEHGNSYFKFPSWVPWFGTQRTIMPLSVFDLDLINYEAYDEGRLPFLVDVKAFFRISDSDTAAQRVSSFEELREQLVAIVQGSVRTVLATNEIEEIMQGRGKFGTQFTQEVTEQLKNWGVSTVKNIELMDIRDARGSEVIHNIMAKKKSFIEMESRQEVAKNKKVAEVAEIEARREVDLQKQEATQQVGLRTVEATQRVEVANQEKEQTIKEQQRLTKEKEMAILNVQNTRTAQIEKDVALIQADQNKQAAIINAEAKLQTQVKEAEGRLELEKKEAEGIAFKGKAKADAETAWQLAPVTAQTTLAKEIGSNESYQKYLITIRQVEAAEEVGKEQAKALTAADVKIISNVGDPVSGMNGVMDIFTTKGGTNIGTMLEALKNTDAGKKLVDKILN